MFTVEESLEWSEATEEILFDMPDETCEALKVLAAEVRRLRENNATISDSNTARDVLIESLEAEVLRLREAWITCQQDRHDMETRHQQEVERLREESAILREALEEIANHGPGYIKSQYKYFDDYLYAVAKQALQRAGGK